MYDNILLLHLLHLLFLLLLLLHLLLFLLLLLLALFCLLYHLHLVVHCYLDPSSILFHFLLVLQNILIHLLFLGLSGIVISLLLLATSFIFAAQLGDSGKWLSIVLIFLYVGFFAISIGPLGWLIVSEVFPQKLRGLGTSLGSLSVWFFNAIVSFTFFKILKVFSISGTELTINGESQGNPAGAFLFYAFIGIVAIIWGYFYVPETKGVSLEKIEAFWRKGGHPKDKII